MSILCWCVFAILNRKFLIDYQLLYFHYLHVPFLDFQVSRRDFWFLNGFISEISHDDTIKISADWNITVFLQRFLSKPFDIFGFNNVSFIITQKNTISVYIKCTLHNIQEDYARFPDLFQSHQCNYVIQNLDIIPSVPFIPVSHTVVLILELAPILPSPLTYQCPIGFTLCLDRNHIVLVWVKKVKIH